MYIEINENITSELFFKSYHCTSCFQHTNNSYSERPFVRSSAIHIYFCLTLWHPKKIVFKVSTSIYKNLNAGTLATNHNQLKALK